jgi:transcriptional regulator with XRE-family HTH domain
MIEPNRRYFDALLAEKKLSLRGLAAKMGMSHSQLSLTFSGVRKLTIEEAAQISKIFGEPIARVIENAGVTVRPERGRRVPVIGAVGGDGTVAMNKPKAIERATAPEDVPDDAVAIQFRTAGTPLDWMDGAVSFCRPFPGLTQGFIGRFCACQIRNGPLVMATPFRGYSENSCNLRGFYCGENIELDWAAPILLTRH